MTPAEDSSIDLLVPELTPGARRIVEVASELFYRNGIHAVGVDTIAAESGITKRTLYDRFRSKENLIAVHLQVRHEAWWTRLEQRLSTASKPRVLAVFDAYTDDQLPSDRGCAFLNAAGELPTGHPGYRVVQAHKRAVRQRLEEVLRDEWPNLDDPETMADHLFLLLEGAIAHRGLDDGDHLLVKARNMAEHLVNEGRTPVGG